MFTLIERVMCLNEEKIQFLKCIWNNIGKLIEINSSLSTKLLLDYFIPTNDLENLLNSLESKPLDLMRVLKCLIDCDQSTNWSVKDSPLISKCSILFEPWIHERYIELLCKYEPDEAARFLQSTSTYRPKVALQICTKSDNQQAKAILYEKEDKFTEALDLLLDKLDKDLILINNDETSDQLKDEQLFKKLFSQFENLIQFAQRCSEKLDNPENREFLWYPLLQRVTSFHEITDKLYPESRSFSIDLCNNMFNNMMGYISMLTLLTWILESSITDSESIGQFSKIRYLLTAMLDAYNYEASLLTAYNDTIKSELYRSLSNYVYLSKKGFIIKSNSKCGLCNGNCNSSSESLIIFQCHSYHVDCLSIDNRNLGCPLCNQNSSLIKLKCNDDDGSGSKDQSDNDKDPIDEKQQQQLTKSAANQPMKTIYDEFVIDDIEEIEDNINSLNNNPDKFKEWERLSNHLRNDLIPRPLGKLNKIQLKSTVKQFNQPNLTLIPRGYLS